MKNDQLKNESVYDQDRFDRYLWQLARTRGVSRRRVLKLMASGVGLAAANGLLLPVLRQARADDVPVVKRTPPDLFITHGSNREMRWEALRGQDYLVSNDRFFVRNHTRTPHIDMTAWRLHIYGSGVRNPIELSYAEILALGAASETKFIECAGNGRSFFEIQQGTRASGTQWKLGAIGVAEWTGVPLWKVLEAAGLKPTAVDVMPIGLDSLSVRRPLAIEKALEDDTLLVYAMNGQPLPPDHGFPLRLLVPGWVGIANIKWVGSIEVSEEPLFSPWNTTTYRLFGDAYPEEPLLTDQKVKSAFELPLPAILPAKRQLLTGRSWSGHGAIERVDLSVDGGASWIPAKLEERNIPKAWVRWSAEWYPAPGEYTIMARAINTKGAMQPAMVPFNSQGYAFWAIVRHPVAVV